MTTDALLAERSPGRHKHHWSDWVGFVASALALLWVATKRAGVSIYAMPPLILYFLNAVGYLSRQPARRTLHGLAPRIAAYGVTYLVPAFLIIAGHWAPHLVRLSDHAALRVIGGMLGSVGLLLAVAPLWQLRRSFSIEPVARGLVTSGAYALARHPIYLAYVIAYVGVGISAPRPAVIGVLAVWWVLLRIRMRFEEGVLESVYPEYGDYKQRVGALGPRLRRRKPPAHG